MSTQDETTEDSVAATAWHGVDRFRLTDDSAAVNVTVVSPGSWDRSHVRKLRQSADLPGLIPIVDAEVASDDKPYAVTPVVKGTSLAERIPAGSDWAEAASVVGAAGRALHEAHTRGLFHGALSPDQILIFGNDVAIDGVGLGYGATPRAEYSHWVAPEVIEDGEVTERSDVYSLGKILEASLGDSLEDVPRSVRRLIMWSGSDTPEARPPSALEFASILDEGLGESRTAFSPAFIPTIEASQLATRASDAVVAHDLSGNSGGSRSSVAAAGAAATAVGAGAIAASSVRGGSDDDTNNNADTADTGDNTADTADTGGSDPAPAHQVTQEISSEDVTTTPVVNTADDADSDDVEYEVPAAAQTVDLDRAYSPEKSSNRAGAIIGALLALAVAAIAWNLISGPDSVQTDSESAGPSEVSTTESTVTESTATESTAAVPTTATTATTAEVSTTSSSEAEVASTSGESESGSSADGTEDGGSTPATTTVEVAEPAKFVDGAVPASEAGIEVVHGIPGQPVDLYVNGKALIPGFAPGAIAGPTALPAGDYDVSLYAAMDNPPAAAADRSDKAVSSSTVTVGNDPSTIIAHYDSAGVPVLSTFKDQLEVLDPGKSRLVVRHLAAAPPVALTIDGEVVEPSLGASQAVTITAPAGTHSFSAADADGNVLKAGELSVGDGEVASIFVVGSEGSYDIVVQRFSGLASAPVDVPTGTGGLLDPDSNGTGLYLLALLAGVMAIGGGVVMSRRDNRTL